MSSCVAAGLARLGFITELLSKPIRYGYMNGIALTVILSQIPEAARILRRRVTGRCAVCAKSSTNISAGETRIAALAVGAGTLVLILMLKRWPRVPGMLIGVVVATAIVAAFDLEARGISVLGPLPQGLPAPELPRIGSIDIVSDPDGRTGGGTRFVRRHERAVAVVRGDVCARPSTRTRR